MNTEAYLIITIISAIIFIGTAIFLICYLIYLRKTIYNDFFLQHSISLKKLNELNQHYIFYPKKILINLIRMIMKIFLIAFPVKII